MIRLGIDTGGTFTDFILISSDGIRTLKLPSTPDDPCQSILEGMRQLLGNGGNTEVVHGTTVGTNAFLERKGARTLLVTTKGFEDILLIGRQNRSRVYDLDIKRPQPFIDQDNSIGVNERTHFDGSIRRPLSRSVGKRLRALCRQKNIDSVAICLLHSYANDFHEKRLGRELEKTELPVTLSSEILPEFREYERTSTTCINAYLAPVIASYIERLEKQLHGINLYIQQSNGGILPAGGIARRAVHTVLSGPAGGVQGAFSLARDNGIDKIITFDMGGTSTDVSLCDGGLTLTRDYFFDGFPIRNQVIDIHTVGAGGGSIAWIDKGGLLHVGPQSAGAAPGPACYGRGEQITVTDANLALGRIPDRLLGGAMRLDKKRTAKYLRLLVERLTMDERECALGIIRIVNAGMAKAVRAVSVERGYNPKDFTLFSFGGASGVHCCELAAELGIGSIVVPSRAGILSAQGMALSAPALHFSKALFLKKPSFGSGDLPETMAEFEENARRQGRRLGIAGKIKFEKFLDLRYRGQSYELTVPFVPDFTSLFHLRHRQHFGYCLEDGDTEIVAIRITLHALYETPGLPVLQAKRVEKPVPARTAKVCLADGSFHAIDMYIRKSLLPNQRIIGPALIVDDYTTILLSGDFDLTVDRQLNLRMQAIP